MSRKDYVLIAAALKFTKPEPLAGLPVDSAIIDTWHNTASELAAALARDNPRFDMSRFLKACGF
jgi:hypothetical protein